MGEGEGLGPRLIPDPAGSTQDRFEREEQAERVRDAVLELPEDQRAAVILHRFHHLAYEEIAEVLGISLPAVKSRLHRAKLALQKKLAEPSEEGQRRPGRQGAARP